MEKTSAVSSSSVAGRGGMASLVVVAVEPLAALLRHSSLRLLFSVFDADSTAFDRRTTLRHRHRTRLEHRHEHPATTSHFDRFPSAMIAVPFPSAPSHFRAGVPTVVPSESVPYRLAGLPPAAAPSATSSSSTAASSSGASVSSQSSLESDAGGGSCGHVAAILGVADEADKVDASRLELAVKLGIKLSGKESRGGRSRKVSPRARTWIKRDSS
jgi:hypothetical protein